jgi:endonuclease-3
VTPILRELAHLYPQADCALAHTSAWQLLVATILSAQATDKRVNLVTPGLFARFPTVAAMASAERQEIEEEIRSIGIFRNKAKNLQAAARMLQERFDGDVPHTLAELTQLPGVARKTANVVLGVVWGIAEGVVVDTHVARLSWRLGLTVESHNVLRIERDLMALVERDQWIVLSHRLILHGRAQCIARAPRCSTCTLTPLCFHAGS